MENLINIEKCVENELKTNYLTRTNDNELILAVLQKSGIDINMPFSKLLKLKNRPSFKSITRARRNVNFKPCFLTEQESIDDAIKTSVDCLNFGFDAVSIEPTSLQDYSLANHLNLLGEYRVPWLWSLQSIVKGIYSNYTGSLLDIRLGGYFDEEVLSGSQGEGFCEKNEIFPHETSSNCIKCSAKFIECIKRFNKTYNIKDLCAISNCEQCYKLWIDALKIKDSRNIHQRIIDILE